MGMRDHAFSVFAAVLSTLPGCAEQTPAEDRAHTSLGPHYEASAWISTNPNRHCLASNRFADNAEALAFVETLYEAGAETVWVFDILSDTATLAWEGGPYADAMLARLPADPESRQLLFGIAATEARAGGYDPEIDIGQTRLFFWWD